MKRTLIIAAVLLSTVVFALPVTAGSIDTYINGPWLEFGFGGPTTDTYSCPSCGSSSGDNSVYLGAPAWSFALDSPVKMKITDAFTRGDTFEVFDFNMLVLTTPYVAPDYSIPPSIICTDPESCYGSEGFSSSWIDFAAGSHSLTIKVMESPHGGGAAFFRIDRIISTPEPLSLMLLGLGLSGLGAVRRSRGCGLPQKERIVNQASLIK